MKMKEKIYEIYKKIQRKLYRPQYYWVNIITWEYGSGKTFNVFLNLLKDKEGWVYTIANVPYPFVDFFYSTKEDLEKIIEALSFYIHYTNQYILIDNKRWDIIQNRFYPFLYDGFFRPIHFVIDELNLYYNNEERNIFGCKTRNLIKQVRKRNITISKIEQDLSKVPKFTRVNVPDVAKHYYWFNLVRWIKFYYLKTNDRTDLKNEEVADHIATKFYFHPNLTRLFYIFDKVFQHNTC